MNNIKWLEPAGYGHEPATGLWMRPGYASIAYSDGDASEDALMEIIRSAGDVSVFSEELAAACTDWPRRYHLSAERANILRPLGDHLGPGTRTLEVGAGCGAITRYLGECGGEVLALEGSVRRAGIARLRARGLDNVTVLAERFQDFRCGSAQFDVVTLVGVLEYATLFAQEASAALRMLERVRGFLKPGGRLIIAIENQLGLKYLAGAPEDHLGQPMAGVEDLYGAVGPRTFGRHELERLLAAAGFNGSRFLVPMPDYKMPVTVVTEAGAMAADFNAGTLASQVVRRDLQLPPRTHFNLQRAWPVVFANGLGVDLANSFLIEATLHTASSANEVLAFHYSTQRVGRFARETRFSRDGSGDIRVTSRVLQDGCTSGVEGLGHVVEADGTYAGGRLLVEELRDVLTRDDWTVPALVGAAAGYVRALRKVLASEGDASPLEQLDERLPDHFTDATPSNLLRLPDGGIRYFDREWSVPGPTLGWLLLRGLLFSYAGTMVGRPAEPAPPTLRALVEVVLEGLGFEPPVGGLVPFIEEEVAFQRLVTGKDQHVAISAMLEAPLLMTAGPGTPATVAEALATLQHSFNLSAAHANNLHESVGALHVAAAAQSRSTEQLGHTLDTMVQVLASVQRELVAVERDTVDSIHATGSVREQIAEARTEINELHRELQAAHAVINVLVTRRPGITAKALSRLSRWLRGPQH